MDSMWTDKRLGVIGGGNMAEALVRGVIRAGLLTPDRVAVFDISPERKAVFAEMGCAIADNAAGVLGAEVVLLATKPQQLRQALSGVAVGPGQLIVSILAGVTTKAIEALLPPGSHVVRTMPNTPLLVGQGMTALAGGGHATADDVKTALALFAASGDAVEVAEADLDAVTALSGSGPAYLFYFYEALLRGAEVIGLEPSLARRLAFGTLKGSLAMLENNGDEVELRRRVTSPGGTTAAAIAALDNGRFAGVVADALEAACKRSVELGRGNG